MPPFIAASEVPLLTTDLSGTGGAIGGPDDFVVEEIPAYVPAGEGQHVFVWLEKRLLTTPQAISRICEALGLDTRQAGYAGMKDKHGVTRQWLSFEGEGALPSRFAQLDLPGIHVGEVARHGNKLRTGHLRGNRFTVVLRGVAEHALGRAEAVLARISESGLPNYFGPQRFGARGDNAEFALRVLSGQAKPPRDKRLRRLMASALQAQLFNETLARRLGQGSLHQLLDGDVLQRRDSGACFVSSDVTADQQRLELGEVALTGPICGPRMTRPRADSDALRWEDQLLQSFDLQPERFAAWGRNARGARRPLTVLLEGATVEATPDGALRLQFSLPAGSYASVLLREVAKQEAMGPAVRTPDES